MKILDQIMGVDEASDLWNLSPGHIKNLCAEGKLQARKIGKTWILDKNQKNPKIEKNRSVS
jgi:hypothetical protein